MSSLIEATKYLTIKPARIANAAEMAAAQSASGSANLDKYSTIDASRSLETVPVVITLPAHQQLYEPIINVFNRLMFQYNLVMPSAFYFIDPLILVVPDAYNYKYFYVTIKWRVGSTVYRYWLYGQRNTPRKIVNIPEMYAGQLIQPNCVFEVWNTFYIDTPWLGDLELFGPPNDLQFKTSLLRVPETADVRNVAANISTIYDIVDSGLTPPLAQGESFAQPSVAFLDN